MNRAVEKEISSIAGRAKIPRPEALVAFATDHPDSALHGQFDWNDSTAAHAHRLDQARNLIRVYLVTHEEEPTREVRKYLSVQVQPKGRLYRDRTTIVGFEELRLEISIDIISRHINEWRIKGLAEGDSIIPLLEEQLAAWELRLEALRRKTSPRKGKGRGREPPRPSA